MIPSDHNFDALEDCNESILLRKTGKRGGGGAFFTSVLGLCEHNTVEGWKGWGGFFTCRVGLVLTLRIEFVCCCVLFCVVLCCVVLCCWCCFPFVLSPGYRPGNSDPSPGYIARNSGVPSCVLYNPDSGLRYGL